MAISPAAAWAQPPQASLHDNTPRPVERGLAHLRGARSTRAAVTLNVDLATREPAQLKELIRAASAPGSPSYGHYLTPEQYDARFAPSAGELAAVETWLRGLGLHVAGVSPDNALVRVTASTVAVERAFGLTSASATLHGSVNPNGSEVTECRFEYGTTMLLGSSAPCAVLPGSGTSAVEVSAPVTGLEASRPYYFRLTAGSAGGVGSGLEEVFTTLAPAGPPEFGRCLKAPAKGAGEYENASCTKASGTGNDNWSPAAGGGRPLVKAEFGLSMSQGTELRLESGTQLLITCKGQSGGGKYGGTRTVADVVFTLTACQRAGGSCQSGGTQAKSRASPSGVC